MTYIEIDAASNNGVENIRELQKALKYSHTGKWRVVVLDEALALDTPLPTPQGWATVGKVAAGDYVFGSNGSPVKVVRKTEVFNNKECFKVFFKDGSHVLTSANHKWVARRTGSTHKERVLTTEEMFQRGHRYSIPASPVWDLPEADLPTSPYLLGLWLGDGSKNQLHISGVQEDLEHYQDLLSEEGYSTRIRPCPGKSAQRLTFSTSRTQWDDDFDSTHARAFRKGPWFNNKHIPQEFLRSSRNQRQALLQGLMDSDGWVGEGGWCTFVGTEILCQGVKELLTTLGVESNYTMVQDERSNTPYGKLHFSPREGLMPVTLPRKVARVKQATNHKDRRTITHIEATESQPTQCIEVDSPDHLFLAGPTAAVTHNCHSLSQAAFNALLKSLEEPADKTVFILASTKPESIPDTVRSRAMAFRFSHLSVPDIAYRVAYVVAEEGINLPDPRVIVRIAEVADGSLRGALITLQQLALLDSPTVEDVNELSGNSVSTTDLMYAMISGSLANLEVETTIMFSKSYDVEKLLKDLLNTLKKFHDTSLVGSAQFLACMEVIWNMRRVQAGSTITARTQLEAGIFAMFVQNFWDGEDAHRSGEAVALTTDDVIRQAGV